MADFQCHAIQLRKYAKDPRQDSVQCNFSYARYPEKYFTKIYRDLFGKAMLLAIRMVTNMTAGKRKHLSPGFATASEFISQGTHKHKST